MGSTAICKINMKIFKIISCHKNLISVSQRQFSASKSRDLFKKLAYGNYEKTQNERLKNMNDVIKKRETFHLVQKPKLEKEIICVETIKRKLVELEEKAKSSELNIETLERRKNQELDIVITK